MYRPTEKDRDTALEYRGAPIGPHSPTLQMILDYFRSLPVEGKYVVVCSKPHHAWTLARLTNDRSAPIEILPDTTFGSFAEAEWEIFKRRWRETVGSDLE